MVDGVALVVDAAEGPMYKYVLSRALALGLKPVVVRNRIVIARMRLLKIRSIATEANCKLSLST
jgi:predicted membrane GTPase involved in stress response